MANPQLVIGHVYDITYKGPEGGYVIETGVKYTGRKSDMHLTWDHFVVPKTNNGFAIPAESIVAAHSFDQQLVDRLTRSRQKLWLRIFGSPTLVVVLALLLFANLVVMAWLKLPLAFGALGVATALVLAALFALFTDQRKGD